MFAFLGGPYVCVPFLCLLQISRKVDCKVGSWLGLTFSEPSDHDELSHCFCTCGDAERASWWEHVIEKAATSLVIGRQREEGRGQGTNTHASSDPTSSYLTVPHKTSSPSFKSSPRVGTKGSVHELLKRHLKYKLYFDGRWLQITKIYITQTYL